MITEMQCKFLDAAFAHENKFKQNLILGEGKNRSFYWVTKDMRLEDTRDKWADFISQNIWSLHSAFALTTAQ